MAADRVIRCPAARVIDVDRTVIEVSGTLLTVAPKGRKTIYPAPTPQGATRWPAGSWPASSPPEPSSKPAPTRSG